MLACGALLDRCRLAVVSAVVRAGTTPILSFGGASMAGPDDSEMGGESAVDVSLAGHMAMEQMEAIEQDYKGREGYQIGMMINIVQIIGPDGTIENRVQHNALAPFLALGLMRVVEELILHPGE
jgi:hypothetical protein